MGWGAGSHPTCWSLLSSKMEEMTVECNRPFADVPLRTHHMGLGAAGGYVQRLLGRCWV